MHDILVRMFWRFDPWKTLLILTPAIANGTGPVPTEALPTDELPMHALPTDLPEATEGKIIGEMLAWRNAKGGGDDWWTKLQRRPQKGSITKCLHTRFHGTGTSIW